MRAFAKRLLRVPSAMPNRVAAALRLSPSISQSMTATRSASGSLAISLSRIAGASSGSVASVKHSGRISVARSLRIRRRMATPLAATCQATPNNHPPTASGVRIVAALRARITKTA